MTILPIGSRPVRAARATAGPIPRLSRRRLLQISAAATAAGLVGACGSDAPAAKAVNGIVPWPDELYVPPVFAPGYGEYPDYEANGETGPWPKILSDRHKRQLERYSDLILPASNGPYGPAPAPSEIGIADFFDDWVSAPYPYMTETRGWVHRGFAWLDAQMEADHGTDWLGASDAQATGLLDRMRDAEADGPMGQPRGLYDHLRKLIIGAYYTTEAGEADLGHVTPAPITGDYPGPTGEALDHILALIEARGLSTDDLPIGVAPYPDKVSYAFTGDEPA